MDLQTRKIAFIQEFLRFQNEDIIRGLEKMLHKRKAELYGENLKPMSIEQFNSDIDDPSGSTFIPYNPLIFKGFVFLGE